MSESEERIVFVVDDDPSVRKSLGRLLGSAGYRAELFESASAFLAREPYEGVGCIVLDVRLPEVDGLQLQEALREQGSLKPIVFITGHGDIPMSVQAMKAGALDFLTKPVDEERLVSAVENAFARSREINLMRDEVQSVLKRYHHLTPREREVMEGVVAGKLNKQIAWDLGTVEKTVKVHRGRVMDKMQIDSVAELVLLSEKIREHRVQYPGDLTSS